MGYSAEGCHLIVCNLCAVMGQPYRKYPRAFRGYTSGGSEPRAPEEPAAQGASESRVNGAFAASAPVPVVKKKIPAWLRRAVRRSRMGKSSEEAGEEAGVAAEMTSRSNAGPVSGPV